MLVLDYSSLIIIYHVIGSLISCIKLFLPFLLPTDEVADYRAAKRYVYGKKISETLESVE